MIHSLSKSLVFFITLACGTSIMACEGCHKESKESHDTLQDSKKAVEHFDNKLAFETNPHGVEKVVKGEEKNITIIDVRDEKSFEEGHIPGAINMPWTKYESFKGDDKEFKELRKDGFNYVYCYEPLCNLGAVACKKFASLKYPVKEIAGGFKEWKDRGLDIEKGKEKSNDKDDSKKEDSKSTKEESSQKKESEEKNNESQQEDKA